MIIWSRWGIFVMAFVGIGIGLGFILKAIVGVKANGGAPVGVFVGIGFILAAGLLYLAVRQLVGKVIDKPTPAVGYVQLAEPIKHENGSVQTHQVVPLVDPATGQQAVRRPVSTLFFIPVRYWPFILGALGVLVFVINLIIVLTGGR
ncbi:hypothetical protein BH11ACT3_BH11ACT3_25840 [soil metagenome]